MFVAEHSRSHRTRILLGVFLCAALRSSSGQALVPSDCSRTEPTNAGLSATERRVREIRGASFPQLAKVDLQLREFHSQADYFRTRFSVPRFLFLQRMRYFVEVNPALFGLEAPPDGICAVLAHELSHVVSLEHGNRIRRLSLVRLLSKSYTAQFERKTDLEAIRRGYGDGLKSYRTWFYAHIPAVALPAKRRNYFSPEEIEAIQRRTQERTDLFASWSKHAPRNLQEILTDPIK
jgi:hypothetical protein